MAYSQKQKLDIGNQVKVGPNTQGTGTRGIPVAVALLGKGRVVPAVSDPEKLKPSQSDSGVKQIKDVRRGGRKPVKNYNKFE